VVSPSIIYLDFVLITKGWDLGTVDAATLTAVKATAGLGCFGR
jgi:hypothetical protein